MDTSIEPLMLTEEAARILRKSPRTLEAWRERSHPSGLPYVRIEGQPRYRRSDLLLYIEKNVHNTSVDATS